MPELALHFAIPFALAAPVIGLRKAAVVSLIALLPDLDFVFQVHRSISHSMVLVLVGALVLMVSVKRFRPGYSLFASVLCLGLLSHSVMDLFSGSTPLLWPLVERPLSVEVGLDFVIGKSWRFDWTALLKWSRRGANPLPVYDGDVSGPIVTSEGAIVSILLVTIPVARSWLASFRKKALT